MGILDYRMLDYKSKVLQTLWPRKVFIPVLAYRKFRSRGLLRYKFFASITTVQAAVVYICYLYIMKLAIQFRNTWFSHNALRVFTYEFWEDMTSRQPDHDFMIFSDQKIASWPAPATTLKYIKKTGLPWLDTLQFKIALAAWQPDRLITVQETGFTVSSFQKGRAVAIRQVVFSGAQPPPKSATRVIEMPIALRHVIPSLTWAEAESVKTQYTAGRSFFLFAEDISDQHRLIELLKAFSAFKKWQLSNMQLVIAGSSTAWTDDFEEKLSTYKFKDDVTVLKKLSNSEIARLTAASYAMVYPAAPGVFPMGLLWAVQGHKAVIAADNPACRKVTGSAIWVEDNNTAEGFAKAMILLYKDESRQQELVQQMKEQAAQYTRNQLLETAWQCIEQ